MRYVVDLDGTLTDDAARTPFLNDMDRYHAEGANCATNGPVVEVIRALYAMTQRSRDRTYQTDQFWTEVWTGRPERYREATERWLQRHAIPYHRLRMAADGDGRASVDIKLEWARALPYGPTLVFDDRRSCVEKWREAGFVCIDVKGEDS